MALSVWITYFAIVIGHENYTAHLGQLSRYLYCVLKVDLIKPKPDLSTKPCIKHSSANAA